MQVIGRDELGGISSVVVDGAVHDIGLLQDFRGDPRLKEFVPDLARLSMGWVRLLPGQELAVHRHPTKSMIVVAEGRGHTLGVVRRDIGAGDVVVVPAGDEHGFVGAGEGGFRALSIQFEGEGLYEDPDAPRVAFAADARDVEAVRAENERRMRAYGDGALVALVRAPVASAPKVRERVLDHLQEWSDGFQRVMAARVAAELDPLARAVAERHLVEESGHNALLGDLRAGREALRDPVVAAAVSWFVDRMTSSTTVERTVLAHLVLEGSGLVFHEAGLSAFAGSRYFELHRGADAEHLEMGYRALAERRDWTVAEVGEMLRAGWEMITLLSDRIAERAERG